MTSLTDIERRAKSLADARDRLRDLVTTLNDGITALQREYLPDIRRAVKRVAEADDALKAQIEAAPELFVKPKTQTLHGIRLGFMKGKGGIEWGDADRVVQLIEKHFPEQLDVLCKTTRKPVKDALAQLDVASLKKLGCRVVDSGEIVFIKAVDSAVDKMVEALLKAATEEATA